MHKYIWLVGAGPMAIEYITVLNALNVPYKVIGRGAASAEECRLKTGAKVRLGGLEKYISECEELPSAAIVSVGVEELSNVAITLIRNGIKRILVEKPGGLNEKEISSVFEEAKKQNAEAYIAYNRRFYSSTRKAQEIINADGGITSFHFEFTEWSHQIVNIQKAPGIKENWLLANSSHVIDLAFFLGGKPKKITGYKAGGLDWHPSGSIFVGAGIAENGALFSYQANWEAPGRWGVEVLTKKHRLILRPLEKLYIQKIGSVTIEEILLEDDIDKKFKPGLYLQVQAFIEGRTSNMIDIREQSVNLHHYCTIGGE